MEEVLSDTYGPGSRPSDRAADGVSPVPASIPIARPSVQKVGAVLRKAGFERSLWLKSGRIKGWGSSTAGYSVKLHWDLSIKVTYYGGAWERGSDAEREAKHAEKLQALATALVAAGLSVERHQSGVMWSELRVRAQGIEARSAETGTGSVYESPVGTADAPQGDPS